MRTAVRNVLISVLQAESKLVLLKYKPKIIAITGSVGKTSTKDAVYAMLSKVSYVRKSEKSYNSELGLPLTILGVPNGWNDPKIWLKDIVRGLWLIVAPHKYPEWLILEVGVGKPGDMKRTASWLKTDAVVITAIGETPAHIEFFDSRKHLVEEKSGLIKTLKRDGILVLNRDDETVLEMGNKTKNRIVTYGFNATGNTKPDIIGSSDAISYDTEGKPQGVIFRVDVEGKSLPVVIEGVFGKNHVFAAMATIALSFGLKFNILDAINALKNYDVPPGRMRLLKGINDTLIIDDTHNSSPYTCESALNTLGEVKCSGPARNAEGIASAGGRKIAVLGDMLELGKHTVEAHQNIGRIVKEKADILIIAGPRAEAIKAGALEAGMKPENIFEFLDAYQAGDFIKTYVKSGDVILVKGSQGMRMERVVGAILFDQANKANLIVRQDKEWLAKK